VARSDATILLLGESGTGKQLIARAIHKESARRDKPFVEINCASMQDTLLESELFGHEKGAYTDARSMKKGKFELVAGGTLFLDEIGDLSNVAQAKTLKAVEEKKFERLGGERSISADFRIISATNRDLEKDIEDERFRSDLYYRLNEICLNIPPLRDRKEDIPLLANHFIKEFNKQFDRNIKGLSNIVLAYLMKHDWPGNVRELRSLIKSSVLLANRETIWLEDMSFKIELNRREILQHSEEHLSLKYAEKLHILKVLNYTRWQKNEAVRLLRISRPTLDKKIKEYGLKEEISGK
jgi:transcriptional regulator with PAS, ATPase and Fis domain